MSEFTQEQLADFEADTEEEQELSTLKRAMEMLAFQENLKAEHEKGSADASSKINHLRRQIIPTIMAESGMELAVIDGVEVKVATTTTCSIPRDRQTECVDWLREHGHGGIVKSNLVFPGDNDSIRDAIAAAGISSYGLEETKVHYQTLKAWANEMTRNGETIPDELFNVDSYTWTTTKPQRK